MIVRTALLLACSFCLAGCESVHFYQQAIGGQASLLWQRTSVDDLLEDSTTDTELRRQLKLSKEILDFAAEAGLPVEDSYQSYSATGRDYVVWNVFAAPEFELQLETSCFPVAGCVSYRGYFKAKDAEAFAAKQREQGLDVYVGGVAAYSTLGWFNDPLLDTFLFRSEIGLAALLFHELAHKLIYVKDDTRFNESAATAVERFLLKQWLADQPETYARYLASDQRRKQVISLIDETREELREIYINSENTIQKREDKSRVIAQMRERYQLLQSTWPEGREFEAWMNAEINNAKLETVADYNAYVPTLMAYLEQEGMAAFKLELVRLAGLNSDQRAAELQNQTLQE